MADIVPMSLVAVHMYKPFSALVVCLNIITLFLFKNINFKTHLQQLEAVADIVPMSLVVVHMYEPCSALVVCLNKITPFSLVSTFSGT